MGPEKFEGKPTPPSDDNLESGKTINSKEGELENDSPKEGMEAFLDEQEILRRLVQNAEEIEDEETAEFYRTRLKALELENITSPEESTEKKVTPEDIQEIESLEQVVEGLSKESQALVSEVESLEVKLESFSKEKYHMLIDKLSDIRSSWWGVKERALMLGITTVGVVDFAIVGNLFSGAESGNWVATTGSALIGAAIAVNIMGYNINKLIHSAKEGSAYKAVEGEGNKRYETE